MPSSARDDTWTVYRQDETGNRFLVAVGLCREAAESLVRDFEARGHKQVYWADPAKGNADPQTQDRENADERE